MKVSILYQMTKQLLFSYTKKCNLRFFFNFEEFMFIEDTYH